jgi:dipeptidyl aminopeptidase/acylaminoacyl peptidase
MTSPIMPDYIYSLTSVSAPSLSPDGTRLAFVRSRVDRETMETRSQVMMMALPEGEATPFTGGPSDGTPRFSPDGQSLAFIRSDADGRQQLWMIPAFGGEGLQLTSVPGGVTEPAWSPDSRSIVFVSDVDPDRPPDGHDPKKDPMVRVVRRIRYRADTIGWRGDAFRHLFVVDTGTGEVRQLTDDEGEDSSPAWSPDGTEIAFISDRGDGRDFVYGSGAYVVSATGGEPELWSDGLSSVSALTWSPDGARLAAAGSDDPDVSEGWQSWVFVLEPGSAPERLTDDSIKPATGSAPVTPPPEMRWTDDGLIRFLADAKGESGLYEVSEARGDQRRLVGGGALFSAVAFAAETRRVVVVSIPPRSSGELWLYGPEGGTRRSLVEYNDDYFDAHPAARLEKFSISRGGKEIELRLFMPPGFDVSQRYPMVLDIHGGPHGVFSDTFSPIQQVLATNGYIVLAVNPRGSSTYGAGFMKAVLRDWGGEDYLDIMAAVDEVSSRPYVDESRLGVTGYSYGGFMSSWIVGHDSRFGAAVVGAPVTNLSSFYGTSDIGVRFGEVQLGGMRKDSVDIFLERSPLTYAPNVETPVLLLHGEADVRCPIEQSEQYFVTLKRLGKEVEFVRFPGCSHSLLSKGHPRMREEYLSRMLAWFDDHLSAEAK